MILTRRRAGLLVLLSEGSAYMAGAELSVDGGVSL